MSLKEQVQAELKQLDEDELKQVADYVAFLKFQSRINKQNRVKDSEVAALYAELAEEDRGLAEAGIEDYSKGLMQEDLK